MPEVEKQKENKEKNKNQMEEQQKKGITETHPTPLISQVVIEDLDELTQRPPSLEDKDSIVDPPTSCRPIPFDDNYRTAPKMGKSLCQRGKTRMVYDGKEKEIQGQTNRKGLGSEI